MDEIMFCIIGDLVERPMFQFLSIASCPITWYHQVKSGSILLTPYLQKLEKVEQQNCERLKFVNDLNTAKITERLLSTVANCKEQLLTEDHPSSNMPTNLDSDRNFIKDKVGTIVQLSQEKNISRSVRDWNADSSDNQDADDVQSNLTTQVLRVCTPDTSGYKLGVGQERGKILCSGVDFFVLTQITTFRGTTRTIHTE
ncbi:hypothetical protein BTVI_14807 [Pitangus sulphuratus]|nr:hypothetical protein BTVI_14807 [Pitangus sulphuratus]